MDLRQPHCKILNPNQVKQSAMIRLKWLSSVSLVICQFVFCIRHVLVDLHWTEYEFFDNLMDLYETLESLVQLIDAQD